MPHDSALRVVVTGHIAQHPVGGATWDHLQYAAGLARLGHDVFYVEDTGRRRDKPLAGHPRRARDENLAHLSRAMDKFELRGRWAYRSPVQGTWSGLSDSQRDDLMHTADLVLNISGSLRDPAAFGHRAVLAYVDSDPVFTQVKLMQGRRDLERLVSQHDVHFTFGETLDDRRFDTGHHWMPTRQPILLDAWQTDRPPHPIYTTVMNWNSNRPVRFRDEVYGQEDVEFRRFLDLPVCTNVDLEIAVPSANEDRPPADLLRNSGWRVVRPSALYPDLDSYRSYVASSRAEWSVAKNGYVAGRAGWFSRRSACYLAAGRPVITQDTGFSSVLPVGLGLVTFDDLDDAADAVASVEQDYPRHAQAAREVATLFSSDTVLTDLVARAMSDGSGANTSARLATSR